MCSAGGSACPALGGRSGKRNKSARLPTVAGGSASVNRVDLQECKGIAKLLFDHSSAWPFRQPVDVTLFPDYYDLIPLPIDVGTIRVTRMLRLSRDVS